jgi:hypothetical protein
MTLNIAVLTPTPSASVRMTTIEKPGAFRIARKPAIKSRIVVITE